MLYPIELEVLALPLQLARPQFSDLNAIVKRHDLRNFERWEKLLEPTAGQRPNP